MPVVDNILIGPDVGEKFEYPSIPVGDFIERTIQERIDKLGDSICVVSLQWWVFERFLQVILCLIDRKMQPQISRWCIPSF